MHGLSADSMIMHSKNFKILTDANGFPNCLLNPTTDVTSCSSSMSSHSLQITAARGPVESTLPYK